MVDAPTPDGVSPTVFSDALSAVVSRVMPVLVGGDGTLQAEAAMLEPLSEPERILALLVRGVAASHGVEATRDHALLRLDHLVDGAEVVARVAAAAFGRGPAVTQAVVEGLWRRVERAGPSSVRLPAACALALAPSLPLALDESVLAGLGGDPDVAAAIGLAIGRAARAGDRQGAELAFTILKAPGEVSGAPSGLEVGVLKGLGGGFLGAGLRRLAVLAGASIFDPAAPLSALAHAIGGLAIPFGLDAPSRLEAIERLLRLIPDIGSLSLLDSLPRAELSSALAAFAPRVLTFPAPARLAIIRHLLAAGYVATLAPETLHRERHPEVIAALLDGLGEAAPDEVIEGWAAVSDRAVRVRLADRVSVSERGDPTPHAAGAEIIALPPQALARDDLDRLRLAISEHDSDRLVELATRVSLDRRQEARSALLAALDVPDAAQRRAVVEAIGRIGGALDAPRLIDAARRYRALDGTVAAALRALGARQHADALAAIFARRLKWADDDAVDDWWALAGDGGVQHLLGALSVRYYPLARAGAARALARHRVQEVVFALRMAGLSDPSERARQAALQGLAELSGSAPSLGELAGYGVLFRDMDDIDDAVDRAREAGAAAVPGLRRVLAKGSWRRRRAACEALAGIEGAVAEEALVGALEDADEDVRFSALEALLQRGWEPSTPREHTLAAFAVRRLESLMEQQQHVDAGVLFEMLESGGYGAREDVLAFLDVTGLARQAAVAPHDALRFRAAKLEAGLASTGPDGVASHLRVSHQTWHTIPHRARISRLLSSASAAWLDAWLEAGTGTWRARQTIAEALAWRAEDEALQPLARLVRDDEDEVRRAALLSLLTTAAVRADAGHDVEPVAGIVALSLESPFPDDREDAARTLGALGAAALPLLERLAGDPFWEARQAAASALSEQRERADLAADLLITLAVDGEFKVAETARAGLARLGVLPSLGARARALSVATTLSMEGLEAWFDLGPSRPAHPDLATAVDAMVDETPLDALAQRIGIVALLRVEHLAGWLEDVALGRHGAHVGARLAASTALRALVRQECQVCGGQRTLSCPGCDGLGDNPCRACRRSGTAAVECPNPTCSAREVTRRIDSPRCPTCHGRGEVPVRCACQDWPRPGRRICALCAGTGRIRCVACGHEGHGG